MVFVIDGRPLIQKKAGIGSYTAEFISHFADNYPDWVLYVITPQKLHMTTEKLILKPNVVIKVVPFMCKKVPNMLWYYLYSAFIARKLKADYFLSTNTQYPFFMKRDVKCVIAVNDFVVKDFAQTMTIKNRISSLLFDYSIKKANNFWCISEYTKNELIRRFPYKRSSNFFTGITVSNLYSPIIISEVEKVKIKEIFGIKDKFILFVGSIEPRKNLQFLLKLAPSIYDRTNIQTLIVGSAKWKNDIEKQVKSDALVVVNKFVEDEDLVKLYNLASCYVSTSLNEGFGLPQLEALKCGCPVVSPRNSAMIEVVENRGTLVEGWNENNWVEAIINEIDNPHKCDDLTKYDWDIKSQDMYNFLCHI